MSFIDRVPPPPPEGQPVSPAESASSGWRWFPYAIVAALVLVIGVNGLMVWRATSTFPGLAGQDGFDLSNGYGKVLDAAAREAALGWTVQASLSGAKAVVQVRGSDGSALAGARVTAEAERPLGPAERTALSFRAAPDGSYVSAEALPAPGQWDLLLTIARDGRVFHATRRVVMK